jgi:hypothetical protein
MRAERIEIDSRVLGGNVLAISDFDPEAEFAEFERRYVEEFHPLYVSCKIPLERISEIQILESQGFGLTEGQIRASVKLRKMHDVSRFPYDFEPVTREEDLTSVLEIAGTTFAHDRFSMDPRLAPGVSGARYREYVRRSFLSADEAVFRLVDRASRQVVAFKTHRYVSKCEVLFLLGGVHPEYKNLGLGLINEYCEFNMLMQMGIRFGITHISASNYPIFNLEIGNLGFRVLTTFAVMRKIYAAGRLANP